MKILHWISTGLAAAFVLAMTSNTYAQTSNGRATTAAPTYTNNTAAPLSLDLDGNLRVNCLSGCSGGGGGGDVNIIEIGGNPVTTTLPVSGPLTDTELRATPVPVSGTVSTGGLTDAELRATPVPVSGTVSTGGLTDAELRATPVGVDAIIASSNFSAIMAATTNATSVKASAGSVTEISVYNVGTDPAWLKLYNSASAPTCGAGTIVGRYLIPAAASGGAGSNVNIALGKAFSTGIAFCVTEGITDADTTAVAANEITINLTYR